MNLWGTIPSAVAAVVAIMSAFIAYNSYRLARHYRDPIWVIDFDRVLRSDQWAIDDDAVFPLKLRVSNHGPDTAKDVTVRATWDPTDVQRIAKQWPYVEGGGSRSWELESFYVSSKRTVWSDWDEMLKGNDARGVVRVEWKGPQLRRRHAEVALPRVVDHPSGNWWRLPGDLVEGEESAAGS